jgi:uncharacterized protein (DUF2141 family)
MKQPRRLYAAALALAAAAGVAAVQPAAAQPGCEGPASDTYINVVVDGLRNGNGLVAVTLYEDNSRKFLAKGGSLYVGRVDAGAPSTRMCIHVPRPGVYAIAVYHDENGNRKIDRGGVLGIPTEGFGFTNNPPTIASLPSFRSVRINIPRTGLTTHVRLKYP